MATLDDLLNNFGLADEDGGEEKTASVQSSEAGDEQALLESLLSGGQEKTASEGEPQMGSLADLYMQLTETDQEVEESFDKIAEEAALESIQGDAGHVADDDDEGGAVKLAGEYDAAGRIMARGFYDELNKLAADSATELEPASQASTPALGERGTQFQMEVNKAPKGPMDTKGGDEQHKNILKGQADGPAGRAQPAMGPQFATAQQMVTSRASQANAK